jgi:hypothetical protein
VLQGVGFGAESSHGATRLVQEEDSVMAEVFVDPEADPESGADTEDVGPEEQETGDIAHGKAVARIVAAEQRAAVVGEVVADAGEQGAAAAEHMVPDVAEQEPAVDEDGIVAAAHKDHIASAAHEEVVASAAIEDIAASAAASAVVLELVSEHLDMDRRQASEN